MVHYKFNLMYSITKCELVGDSVSIELTNKEIIKETNKEFSKIYVYQVTQQDLKTCNIKQFYNLISKNYKNIKTDGLEIKITKLCDDRVILKILFSVMKINESITFGNTLDSYHIKLRNENAKLKQENNTYGQEITVLMKHLAEAENILEKIKSEQHGFIIGCTINSYFKFSKDERSERVNKMIEQYKIKDIKNNRGECNQQ